MTEHTGVVIRRYDAARDALSLRECIIDHQNFHKRLASFWPDGETMVTDYMNYLDAECAAHNGRILMAHWLEQAAGFVCVVAEMRGVSPDDPSPYAWVHDLYVKPEHRRRGVASMLMAEAERFARAEGAHVLRLGVLDRNEGARSFYLRHRFGEYSRVLTKPLE